MYLHNCSGYVHYRSVFVDMWTLWGGMWCSHVRPVTNLSNHISFHLVVWFRGLCGLHLLATVSRTAVMRRRRKGESTWTLLGMLGVYMISMRGEWGGREKQEMRGE